MFFKSGKPIIYFASYIILNLLLAFNLFGFDPYTIKDSSPPKVTAEGVLFTYKPPDKGVKDVRVSGDFNNWEKPIPMIENAYGIFYILYRETGEKKVVLNQGTYRYRYLIDGIWFKDPKNPKSVYDRYGNELSIFVVQKPIILLEKNPVPIKKKNRYIFYYKDPRAKNVYIVGDFNNWNPFSTPMRKNKAGIWEIELDLLPGTYSYRFVVDGMFKLDPLAQRLVKDRFDNKYNQITIP